MTATETLPVPETPTPISDWQQQFAELRARHPKVREPIVVALHILMQNPDVAPEDAKAQAALHGVRITAASMAGAKRLLERQAPAPDQAQQWPSRKPTSRRHRAQVAPTTDVSELLRATVQGLQAQANERVDRLRAAIREAIEALEAVLDN